METENGGSCFKVKIYPFNNFQEIKKTHLDVYKIPAPSLMTILNKLDEKIWKYDSILKDTFLIIKKSFEGDLLECDAPRGH